VLQTTIKHTNDSKRGGFELFRYDKVFGQGASQAEVTWRRGCRSTGRRDDGD
jgi:hypothetical protein